MEQDGNISQDLGSSQDESSFASQGQQEEKLLPQSHVNEIVKRAKIEAAEKVRKEMMGSNQGQPMQQVMQGQQMGGMPQHSEDDIRRMFHEEAHKQAVSMHANSVASEFNNKLSMGMEKYPDLDQKVSKLKLDRHPDLVLLINSVDNTADVMHELAEHPEKFINLSLMADKDPELAFSAMQRLSSSVKQNQSVTDQPYIPDPLSQTRPSTIGTDNGSLSVRDFKNRPWNRG